MGKEDGTVARLPNSMASGEEDQWETIQKRNSQNENNVAELFTPALPLTALPDFARRNPPAYLLDPHYF